MAYRSGFEKRVARRLRQQKVNFDYEKVKLEFVQPAKQRVYTPDFRLRESGVLVEAKGRLTTEDRAKLLFVKASNPDVRLVILFQDSRKKIRKGSKTSYGDWATKNGFEWSDERKGIPKTWLEKNNNANQDNSRKRR